MVSLVASRLVILLYMHLIYFIALIINRRYYLDARTAFTLLCIGIKIKNKINTLFKLLKIPSAMLLVLTGEQ
jgi:hypothetical protein